MHRPCSAPDALALQPQNANQRLSANPFLQLCTCELFQNGENIVTEGGESNAYFVIAVGFAKVFVRNSEGEGLTEVSTLGPGRAFGELGLIYDQPRSASVVADGVLVATRLDRKHYMELFADFHTNKLFKVGHFSSHFFPSPAASHHIIFQAKVAFCPPIALGDL